MSDNQIKYESLKIPFRQEKETENAAETAIKTNSDKPSSATSLPEMFYEIEYSCRTPNDTVIPGVGKFVLKPQVIKEPEFDAAREIFLKMREIARTHRSFYDFSRFFDRQTKYDNVIIFYKQGVFMKDFEDDYSKSAPFSQYYPNYQMMGYEQLRTYFTWRTLIRKGNITDISLSYAFIYIYELLNNIGVENPQDGLTKLMTFWNAYRVYNKAVDKYLIQWLKDYHIYYGLPHSFREFVEKNNLTDYYPEIKEQADDFGLFCSVSKYDIKKSAFFTDETVKLISDCFSFVLERIKQNFTNSGMQFDDAFFRPTKKLVTWKPFNDALFYQNSEQPDKRVLLSKSEIYICKNNLWTFSTVITSEKGRQFIGYVMKQTEAVLRQITKFKFKLTANINMINQDTLNILTKSGMFIDKIISAAVTDYYYESKKTVVKVDYDALARIRQEALVTQSSLIVEDEIIKTADNIKEDFKQSSSDTLASAAGTELNSDTKSVDSFREAEQNIFADSSALPVFDVWDNLRSVLNNNELQALTLIVQNNDALNTTGIKSFAAASGIMLEVLIDGINEKAMDCIGDNIIDENFNIYGDYIDKVRELLN